MRVLYIYRRAEGVFGMKKICIFITAITVVLLLLLGAAAAEDTDTLNRRIPRVVSIVFDDSGSMYENTDRWAYTSYAMQTFTAMMSSEDTLVVTYLNNTSGDGEVGLKSNKQNNIDSFASTLFGGGTPNRIADGLKKLADEYNTNRKNNKEAKYYLVVMADGELDKGSFSTELPSIVNNAKGNGGALAGADFEAIYFSMKNNETIEGIDCYYAPNGDSIISELKRVSASIMGRTDVTDSCTMSDGVITVNLPYPSHSITLFAQKKDKLEGTNDTDEAVFKNIEITVDGCNSETYYVKCPEDVEKVINRSKTVWKGKNPDNHLGGFVTIVTDKLNTGEKIPILSKGEYKLNVSKYNLDMNNVVILLEPAVKAVCKYATGDSEDYKSFSDIKNNLRIGDQFTVKCGLYELNSDGTTGEEVSSDVLSPKYEISVNDVTVNESETNKNLYRIEVLEEYSEKELKVKVTLDNYNPSEIKETFGKLSRKPEIEMGSDFESQRTITKLDYKRLLSSEITVEFPLKHIDGTMLGGLEVNIDGADGFKSGTCSALKDCVSISGNKIVYKLSPKDKKMAFSSLPEEFTVSLYDTFAATSLADVKIKVIQPMYKIEAENGLEGEKLSTEMLEGNKASISFTLVADYNGSGKYTEIDEYDLKNCVKSIKLEKGGFSGDEKKNGASASFVPVYKGEDAEDFFSKPHTVYASAEVDGKTITSEKLEFSVNKPSYKLEAQNGITSSLTLESIKENTEKLTFVLTADYDGDGKFEPLSENDLEEYKNITVDSGKLPGKTQIEYDSDKKPTGVSFTPFYDDKKNKDIQITSLADTRHKITAESKKFGVKAEEELFVSGVSYKIEVTNQITDTLSLDGLKTNDRKIIFTVLADYDTDGEYTALAEWDSAVCDGLKVDSDGLCGKTQKEYDHNGNVIGISFTPVYDEKTDKASLGSFMGKTYKIKVSSSEKGVSNTASVTVGNVKYKINVENRISAPFTLDTIKTNTQKIVFTVVADYEGKGVFTSIAKWDSGVYDRLKIESEKLPGKFETEYDAGGNPVGKSFTPVYDENNNGGIVFTEVAGKTHTVIARIDGTKETASATVEVTPPVYGVKVIKDGMTFIDVKLRKNEECVVFEISRDGRVLNAAELEGLRPYDIVLSKNTDSIIIDAKPSPNADGTAYLNCRPTYNGWTFIHPVLWNWRSLYKVTDGDMQITLTVANASDTANIHIDSDAFYLMVFLIILAILLVIAWIIFCYMTRMRFPSGTFYRATFVPDPRSNAWCVSTLERKKANCGRFGMFFRSRFFLPFACQRKRLSVLDSDHKARFETVRSDDMFEFVSLPHWKTKDEFMYNTGSLDPLKIMSIVNEESDVTFTRNDITGTPTPRQEGYEISFKMDAGVFIGESSRTAEEKAIVFFLSNRAEREFRRLNNILNNTKRKKR